jgi:hypothetical protein
MGMEVSSWFINDGGDAAAVNAELAKSNVYSMANTEGSISLLRTDGRSECTPRARARAPNNELDTSEPEPGKRA